MIKAFVFVVLFSDNAYAKDFDTYEECWEYGQKVQKLYERVERTFLYSCPTRELYLSYPEFPPLIDNRS
jgi:hypothetical protein